MADTDRRLGDLRRQIDEIDSALHDLLMRRADVVQAIGSAKQASAGGNGVFLRPGREAIVLRNLLAQHRGALPKATLVRLWRELMAAFLRLQGPFSVAVQLPENAPGFWDLARDHFGGLTPLSTHETARQVMTMVRDGRASIGVLPLPWQEEEDAWWRLMLAKDLRKLRIVARLPFGSIGAIRGQPVEALAIGPIEPEETGRDRSLFALDTPSEISRSRLSVALKSQSLEPSFLSIGTQPSESGGYLHLLELQGFLTVNDPRLGALAAQLELPLDQILPMGGYAEPLSAAELGEGGKGKAAARALPARGKSRSTT